jgi:hypothetical protein
MQKKTSKNPQSKSLTYLEIESNSTSYLPVNRNGWWVKFSVYNGYNILLVFTSMFTGQTILRYYDNEDDAVKFINYVIESDPSEEIPQ